VAPGPEQEPAPSPPAPLGGFSRYRIEGEIGRGGMGVVYRVWDLDLDRAVAMKVVRDGAIADVAFTRFVDEARVTARLQHPAVVPVYDVGTDPAGKLYFTMKLVEGHTLTDVVARARAGAASFREYTRFRLIETFREICRAVSYVHERGIIHRDLKPDNVMIGRYGEVQIMDWGIAKAMSDAVPTPQESPRVATPQRTQTRVGNVVGTPDFMAPEQARGMGGGTPQWDVYALGGILHHMLTGRAPEAAVTRFAAAEERAGSLQSPRSFDATIPREVDAICMRALAPVPEARYPTAKEFADDIQAFLEQRPVAAFPEGALRRARKWALRQRRALGGAGAGVAIVVVAVIGARAASARATLEQERAEAQHAQATFSTARARLAALHQAPAALRAERNRLLGLGMSSLQGAQAVRALAPRDEGARRDAFEAALGLGEVAQEDEQWGLASGVLESARETHVDDDRAIRALEEVERARTRVADEHRQIVAGILDGARAGKLERDADYQDALFALVGLREPSTVEALTGALEGVTIALRAAQRTMLLEAQVLTDDEKRHGEGPIPGLEAAVDDRLATPPDRPPTASEPLQRAMARLVVRAAASPSGTPPAFRTLSAIAQERRVGVRSLRVARLASEALGRIGIADVATGALERYLAAEDEELRAVPAAIALCLLGQPSSERVVEVARDRLGTANGLFWKLVGPNMRRFRVEVGEKPKNAEEFLARAKERGAKGDLEGEIADSTRAVEIDPSLEAGWIARGIARRKTGDLEGAIADYTRASVVDPDNAVPWNDRGFAELEHGDLDAAIADLDHSLALRPLSARTHTHRATAYRLKGRLGAALTEYGAALQIDPRFELAYRGRADAHLDGKDAAAAITDYGRAIDLDGTDAEAWAGRAMARLAAMDPDGALADATHAVDLDPTCGPAWIARARVRQARGDVAGSLDDALRTSSLDLRPRDATAARALLAELSGMARRP
jgi:tetratricopeptide (TPR) repeat protein